MNELEKLRAEHRPESIRARLAENIEHAYIGDAVFGGIDGCVTTFAVVASAMGAHLGGAVILILGFANLLADGFSMAVSNYLGTKSERERVDKARRSEQRQIQVFPEGEREEIRQIFAGKGFSGETLEKIVEGITQNRKLWVDTMLREELGLQITGRKPMRAALATFTAFGIVGFIPLLPFLIPGLSLDQQFRASLLTTAFAFTAVGVAKALVVERSIIRSGLETLLTGGGAAVLAYFIGSWLRNTFAAA